MKKTLTVMVISAALALSLGVLAGCTSGSGSSSASASGSASTSASAPAGLANPMTEVSDVPALADKTGLYMNTDMSWTNKKFFLYNLPEGQMAEIQFVLGNCEGSFRGMKSEDKAADISGIEGEVEAANALSVGFENIENKRIPLYVMKDMKTAYATWYDNDKGAVFALSLISKDETDVEDLLGTVASAVNTLLFS